MPGRQILRCTIKQSGVRQPTAEPGTVAGDGLMTRPHLGRCQHRSLCDTPHQRSLGMTNEAALSRESNNCALERQQIVWLSASLRNTSWARGTYLFGQDGAVEDA